MVFDLLDSGVRFFDSGEAKHEGDIQDWSEDLLTLAALLALMAGLGQREDRNEPLHSE